MLALLNAIFWSLFTRSLRPSLSSESPTKATEFGVKTTDCMNNGDNHGPETTYVSEMYPVPVWCIIVSRLGSAHRSVGR